MEGRSRKPMTSGVGIMYYNCNPELRKHWISTRFKELQGELTGEELIDGGPKPNYMTRDEILKKYGRNG